MLLGFYLTNFKNYVIVWHKLWGGYMDTMELYHIHKSNYHDKKWEVGNSLNVSEYFTNSIGNRQDSFSTSVDISFDNELTTINCHHAINMLLSDILNSDTISKEQLQKIKNTLNASLDVLHSASMFKIESALENYRIKYYSNLPSRLHCVYLTDRDGLKYFEETIGNSVLNKDKSYFIYRVLATGNIFKTNPDLLPREDTSYISAFNKSELYWNPIFKNVDNSHNEYLVQGTVKVLEKC